MKKKTNLAKLAEEIARQLGWVGSKPYSGPWPFDFGCFPEDAKVECSKNGHTIGPAVGGTYPRFLPFNSEGETTVFYSKGDVGYSWNPFEGDITDILSLYRITPVEAYMRLEILEGAKWAPLPRRKS